MNTIETTTRALSAAAVEMLAVGAKDAARMVGVSTRSWYRLQAMGRLPPTFKLLGRRVWRVEDLKTWAINGFQWIGS